MPITTSRERKRGRITPTTASGEKEDNGVSYAERKVRFNEGLKADLNLSQSSNDFNTNDVQILRNLAFTMTKLALSRLLEDLYHEEDTDLILHGLHGAAEKLDEVLKVDAGDHETLFYMGLVHYQIAIYMGLPPLGNDQRDIYTKHCEIAHECFLFLRREAPDFEETVPSMLESTRKLLGKVGRYLETTDEEFSDSSNSVSMSDQSCNMEEEDMIQGAVERLLDAMSILPDDNNRKPVDKLANQIYFSSWTGNKQVDECREGLLALAKDAKQALAQHSRDASMLEEVLMIHPNDCEATLYLGNGHYYLWLDCTLPLDSAIREADRHKAIEYCSDVRDKATTSIMVSEAENLLDTLYKRHMEYNYNRATDENVMLMKFVGVLFEAMSLGTDQRCKVAREKSAKDHLLVQERNSLRRQVDTMLMKLSESP